MTTFNIQISYPVDCKIGDMVLRRRSLSKKVFFGWITSIRAQVEFSFIQGQAATGNATLNCYWFNFLENSRLRSIRIAVK